MTQLQLDIPTTLSTSLYEYGDRSSGETHGVVLTKPHIVELILDLADYVPERDLGRLRLLEPSCGHGAFLLPAAGRLVESAERFGRAPETLEAAIRAYDIDEEHVTTTRDAITGRLQDRGVPARIARKLATTWIKRADFLVEPQAGGYDFVVGNPPYIRIEYLAPELQTEYRARYSSLFDRADLYVAFIEHGLQLLNEGGILSYICADRWVLNRYGAPLRRMISDGFQVKCYVDLHQASPFDSDVIAYPAIFAITTGNSQHVMVGKMHTAFPAECDALRKAMEKATSREPILSVYETWFKGDEPWVITSPEHLKVLRDLETRFKSIESSAPGTKVGIGVASGNDKVYIVPKDVDIEEDRLVPLVMRRDIDRGVIHDEERCVINTFRDEGGVVDLHDYPRLKRYLEENADIIKRRHVSKKNPQSWFRTIDRVYPSLVSQPKLLIPDIAGSNEIVFDEGHYHPHHNLYFIRSDGWDMEVLGGLLSSKVALFFVWSYAVKMRGKYLRFQAQYLRRIRVPRPEDIPKGLATSIRTAFRKRDFAKLDELALRAYGLEELPEFDFVDTRH